MSKSPSKMSKASSDSNQLKLVVATGVLVLITNVLVYAFITCPLGDNIESIRREIHECAEEIDQIWIETVSQGEKDSVIGGDFNAEFEEAIMEVDVVLSRQRRGARSRDSDSSDGQDPRQRKTKTKDPSVHMVLDREGIEDSECGFIDNINYNFSCSEIQPWQVKPRSKHIAKLNSDKSKLEIKISGLYLIYAQVTQHDDFGNAKFTILHESALNQTESILSACVGLEGPLNKYYSNTTQKAYSTFNQCHTSRAANLQQGDKVYVKNTHVENVVLTSDNTIIKTAPELTFWGMVKL